MHTHSHTLDLVITSASTSLNAIIFHAVNTTSDHFSIFSLCHITPNSCKHVHFPLNKLHLHIWFHIWSECLQTDHWSTLLELKSSCFLDLSAAFDTTDHSILIHHLSSWYGIFGIAFNRFSSYLSYRSFSVSIDDHLSSIFPLSSGVPQGSCPRSCTLNLYITQLSIQIAQFSRSHHLYVNDTKFFISLVPNIFLIAVSRFERTIFSLSS